MILCNPIHLRLEFKKPCEFFWLKAIHDVDITKCCAKCFIGPFDQNFWEQSHKNPKIIELDVQQSIYAKAYYLCGLSKNFVWALNTHVAFVPDEKSKILIDNDRINLSITNARRIIFWDYTPNPSGFFTKQQRTCRNWIFANYLKDGMPL